MVSKRRAVITLGLETIDLDYVISNTASGDPALEAVASFANLEDSSPKDLYSRKKKSQGCGFESFARSWDQVAAKKPTWLTLPPLPSYQ